MKDVNHHFINHSRESSYKKKVHDKRQIYQQCDKVGLDVCFFAFSGRMWIRANDYNKYYDKKSANIFIFMKLFANENIN